MAAERPSTIRTGSLLLGGAGVIEYGLQLVLPVILVRVLSPESFGEYRLLWLMAMTALAVFPLAMPQSLFHFLPQAAPSDRPRLVGNAMLFLGLSGLVAAALLSAAWPWLPATLASLERFSFLAPAFLALWVMGSLVDALPTADGNARWQAAAVTAMAVFRTVALGLTAVLSQDLKAVLVALCVFALTKVLLVPLYARYGARVPGLALNRSLLARQVTYALPFAVGNALFLLRVQADQWIVASYFPASEFALVSIAAVVLSISTLVRLPLNNATLPRLSELLGEGRTADARALLAKAYTALSLTLLPTLGLLFVIAREVVEIVYTPVYLGAAPLMQIYLLGQMTCAFSAGHLLVILRAGRLAMTISAVCLAISVGASLAGVHLFGLPGAVAGSVISLVVGEAWALTAATRRLGTRIPAILNASVTARVILVVGASMLAAWGVNRHGLGDMGVWFRLVVTTAVYCVVLGTAGSLAGLHRNAKALLLAR